MFGLLASGPALAAGLLTDAVGGSAEAGSVRTITVAGDWQVTCNKASDERNCRMATVGSGKTAQGGTVTVQLASDSPDGLFYFLTPLDLLVAKGAEMRIDSGKTLKLAYRSCHAQGCVIPFRLAGTLERSFRQGTKLALNLFEIDGEQIEIEMSLVGFIAATRAMASD